MRTNTYNTVLRDFANVATAMNRAFGAQPYDHARNGGHNATANGGQSGNRMRLPLDVMTTEEAFIVTAYVPGVNPDNVEITFEGDDLSIQGEFPQAEGDFAKRELYRGTFERRITFNVPVNADAIEATYEHGVLTLRIPKAEAAKPKQIKVVAK
jgi:HSP20 family protein